jgi:hypothetical protein
VNTAGDELVDVVPLGAVRARGTVEEAAGGRLLVRAGGLLQVYDREEFLAGTGAGPVVSLRVEEQERAAPTPDGGFLVAGAASVRAVGPDGGTRWTFAHDPWHGTPRARSAPALSPDGRLVAVVVPTPEPDRAQAALVYDAEPGRSYVWDRLLFLDAATGAVVGRQQLRSLASGVVLGWRPDGGAVAVSCWTAWHSWSTWWAEPTGSADAGDGIRIAGGTWMHALAGFLPGSRTLTQRYAEHVWPDDDRDELAVYDTASGGQVAVLDLAELAVDPEEDEFRSAEVLDGRHVLVPGRVFPAGGPPQTRHWLIDAASLRPLGRLAYPAAVGRDVTVLGDGTWLTEDGGGHLHRWALRRTEPAASA